MDAPLSAIDIAQWLFHMSASSPLWPTATIDRPCTNQVTVHSTDEFLEFLKGLGMTFEQAAAERGDAVAAHNRLETPLYANSIERRAVDGPASAEQRQGS